jgi:hypothetical protein
MHMSDALSEDLDRQITMAHARFQTAMEARLPHMSLATKERYFAALSVLVTRLAEVNRPLRDVLQETFAEAAALIFQELGS